MTGAVHSCAVCRQPIRGADRIAHAVDEPVHERCDLGSRYGSALGRVLAVDDDAQVGATVRDALSDFGYIVRVASGGQEALALMPTFEPDVVLLDVVMPDMSGDAVLDRLHADYPGLPVVMVTAIEDAQRARTPLPRRL